MCRKEKEVRVPSQKSILKVDNSRVNGLRERRCHYRGVISNLERNKVNLEWHDIWRKVGYGAIVDSMEGMVPSATGECDGGDGETELTLRLSGRALATDDTCACTSKDLFMFKLRCHGGKSLCR